ncbi:hypothetical protein [Streptomyces sp. NPDC056160]|uniref:hypothetical protein n=1 Tax=Streptomyces sp. NPDC056160 TaxID=3345731 RepID=UPI0035DC82DB
MIVKLTVEGTEYEYDGDRLLVAEARELKTYTGFTPPKWLAALDDQDPDALAFMIYLAKKRAGESLRFSDLDTLDYADFDMEFLDADDEPDDAGEAGEGSAPADPTVASGASGPTPTPATSPTSEPSPTTTNTAPETSTP